jgi:diguanylate cyclase (GGDEF)-like protein
LREYDGNLNGDFFMSQSSPAKSATKNNDHHDDVVQIESILDHQFYALKFTTAVERQYRQYYAARYLNYSRLTILVGLLMVLALGALDVLFLQTQLDSVLFIRYMWVTPLMLILLGLSLTRYFERYQQAILVAVLLVISLVMITLIAIIPAEVARLYFSGLLLVIIFGFCLARLCFWYATITALIIGAMFNMVIFVIHPETYDLQLAHNFFYWGACALALFCNYFLEHGIRTEYLQAQLLKYQKADLQRANEQLQQLASIDGLTGITNRRHFDEMFAHEWRRAQRVGHSLAVLMLDIDFFKRYNDTYGHQAGDECLSKVAACLRVCLKRPGDLVARYGGEEFVVLLPDLTQEGAHAIASYMCQQVEALGIAHEASDVKPVITISVGAATCEPMQGSTPTELLSKADDALYDAKSAGRNRVVVA